MDLEFLNNDMLMSLMCFSALLVFVLIRNFSSEKSILREVAEYSLLVLMILLTHFIKELFIHINNFSKFIIAVQIAVYGMIIFKIQKTLMAKTLLKDVKDKDANRLIRDLIKFGLVIFFLILFLRHVFDFNLVSILTHSAIITAVVGLALQDTIGNIISGMIISIEKPFTIGEWISVDGYEGKVTEISWRYTKIRTFEDYFVNIPNAHISSNNLINMSKPVRSMVKMIDIGVAYGVPPIKVKKAISEILKKNNKIFKNPEPCVRLVEYADFSINYRISFTISDFENYREIVDDVYSAVWYQFKKYNIEIPFPIRTVINKDINAENAELSEKHAKIREILKGLSLFETISDENLDLLIDFSIVDTYMEGSIICRENDPGRTMFFILDGNVDIFKAGKKIAELSVGSFFGEFGLLTGEKRTATVKTSQPAHLIEIDREAFSVIFEKEPQLIKHVEKIFDERIGQDKKISSSAKQEIMKQTLFRKFKNLFGIK